MTILLSLCLILLIAILLILLARKGAGTQLPEIKSKIAEIQNNLSAIQSGLKEDFRINREENSKTASDNRTELNNTLRNVSEQNGNTLRNINKTIEEKLAALVDRIDANNKTNREELTRNIADFSAANITQLDKMNLQSKEDSKSIREALVTALKDFQNAFDSNIRSFNDLQREKFSKLEERQTVLVNNTETKLESIRTTVEEKLEKTLSERLGQSFDTVGRQLIEVQKGLGEMQTLAQDVGGLKRVLSNVKMRGGFGEVQLHMLLESILAPEQYEANVATKKGGNERVEFAVKFPNKDGDSDFIWLPIDAKFPKDAYEGLQAAYDTGDLQQIENAQKNLDTVIRKMAKDICSKYIDAPNTTNFGIMFLPFEGLFAEVVRKASLLEEIQRDCNVVVTGPTTLAVILNSLQMGFRTLAIQKRSSEVWKILAGVKKEFNLFGGMLGKAQRNIQTGLNQLDDVMGVRTRAIQRQLKDVETMQNENEDDETIDVTDIAGSLFDNEIKSNVD